MYTTRSYQTSADNDALLFIDACPPSHEQLQTVLGKIIQRILKRLALFGHLIEEDGIAYMARGESLDPGNVLTLVGTAACSPVQRKRELCANCQGFSLHAGVR